MPRRFPIVQFPNRPLIVAILAGAFGRTAEGDAGRSARILSAGALLVWAAEELFAGANWFRRLLGVAGIAAGLGRARSAARS